MVTRTDRFCWGKGPLWAFLGGGQVWWNDAQKSDNQIRFHLDELKWKAKQKMVRMGRCLVSKYAPTWASHGGKQSDEIRNRPKVFAQPSSPGEPGCVSPRTLPEFSTDYPLVTTFCRFGPPPDSSGIFYLLLTHDYSLPLRPSPTLWLFREIMNIDLEPPNGIGRCELWDNVLPPFKARPAFVVSFSIASLESIA